MPYSKDEYDAVGTNSSDTVSPGEGSGGTGGGTIVVTGGGTGYNPISPGPSSPGYEGGGDPGGGTAGEDNSQSQESIQDQNTNGAAVVIANAIKGQTSAALIANNADYTHWEFSAFIYKSPDGTIHVSDLLKGPTWDTTGTIGVSQYNIPDGSVIEGYLHNHPTYDQDGRVLTDRSNPDNLDLNAIANADGYADPSHNVTIDTANYRGYIMHDSMVNEYLRSTHLGPYPVDNGVVVYPNEPVDLIFGY